MSASIVNKGESATPWEKRTFESSVKVKERKEFEIEGFLVVFEIE